MGVNHIAVLIPFKNLGSYPDLLKKIQNRLRVPLTGIVDIPTINSLVRFKIDHKIPGGNTYDQILNDALFATLPPSPPVIVKTLIVSPSQVKAFTGRNLLPNQLQDLNACLERFDIKGKALSHFMAQCAHESGSFRWMQELASGWDYDISKNSGKAKRLGNWNVGDGPKYKGVGAIQVTGGNNYRSVGVYLKDPNVAKVGVSYVAFCYAFTASGWWWMVNDVNQKIASGATPREVSRQVNRGNWKSSQPALHEEERVQFYNKAKLIWG